MSINNTYTNSTQRSCLVLCTTDSHESAIKITQHLLANQLAACISLLPEIMSIYRWQGNITQNKEILLLIKTTQANQLCLFKAIKEIPLMKYLNLFALTQAKLKTIIYNG
ncbi:TPA: divalent-cation tolerance protein CutA [Providencia rettgeri]